MTPEEMEKLVAEIKAKLKPEDMETFIKMLSGDKEEDKDKEETKNDTDKGDNPYDMWKKQIGMTY